MTGRERRSRRRDALVPTGPSRDPSWTEVLDGGLQQERTALAWERTAIAMMVAGILLARVGAAEVHPAFAIAGIVQTVVGAGTLVWAGWHYVDLHEPIASGGDVVHPGAARTIGLATIACSAAGLATVIGVALIG